MPAEGPGQAVRLGRPRWPRTCGGSWPASRSRRGRWGRRGAGLAVGRRNRRRPGLLVGRGGAAGRRGRLLVLGRGTARPRRWRRLSIAASPSRRQRLRLDDGGPGRASWRPGPGPAAGLSLWPWHRALAHLGGVGGRTSGEPSNSSRSAGRHSRPAAVVLPLSGLAWSSRSSVGPGPGSSRGVQPRRQDRRSPASQDRTARLLGRGDRPALGPPLTRARSTPWRSAPTARPSSPASAEGRCGCGRSHWRWPAMLSGLPSGFRCSTPWNWTKERIDPAARLHDLERPPPPVEPDGWAADAVRCGRWTWSPEGSGLALFAFRYPLVLLR